MKTGFHKKKLKFVPGRFLHLIWHFVSSFGCFMLKDGFFRKQGTSLKDSLECILQVKFDFWFIFLKNLGCL